MSKEQELIEQNNVLRKQLMPANEKFYGEFLVYLRLKSVFQDQEKLEGQLLEILQDIIEAQKDNLSAEQYFGKNPKILADELLAQLAPNYTKVLKGTGLILGVYVFFGTLPNLVIPQTVLDLGSMILAGLYLVFGLFILFRYLGNFMYYSRTKEYSKKRYFASLCLAGILLVLPLFGIQMLVKTPFKFTLGNGIEVGVILFWVLIGLVLFLRQQDKTMWLPLVFLALVLAGLGIVMRLPGGIGAFLLNSQTGQITTAVILIGALVVTNLCVVKMAHDHDANE